MTLREERAVVTGSNYGIVLSLAESLAAAGSGVILNGFTDQPEGPELAIDLGTRYGVSARYLAADMSTGAECLALIEQIGGPTVYLCSSAASQVTGTANSIDGGRTAL